MTAPLVAFTRPGLARLVEQARAKLSPSAQRQVDEHVTQAESLLSHVFEGLPMWRIGGSDDLWARAADVAVLMEIGSNKISERVGSALDRSEIRSADVRRNAMDSDGWTEITPPTGDGLTSSTRGVTMLSLRAVRRLLMTCAGERGVDFRAGLDAALDFAAEAERSIMVLLLSASERTEAPVFDRAHDAHLTIRAMLAAGRTRLPKALQVQAFGEPVRQTASNKPEATDPGQLALELAVDGRTVRHSGTTDRPATHTIETLTAVGAALGVSRAVVKRRLEATGLLADPHWCWAGDVPAIINGRPTTTRMYCFRPGIAAELLRREVEMATTSGGAK